MSDATLTFLNVRSSWQEATCSCECGHHRVTRLMFMKQNRTATIVIVIALTPTILGTALFGGSSWWWPAFGVVTCMISMLTIIDPLGLPTAVMRWLVRVVPLFQQRSGAFCAVTWRGLSNAFWKESF